MAGEEFEALLKGLGGAILEVGRPVRTVEEAVKASKADRRQVIKSLLFIAEDGKPVLVIVDGESRVDLDKVSKIFGPVRLATPREVIEVTGYEVGAVPPIGVKVRTIMDPRVLENSYVIGGGGSIDRLSKLDPRKIVERQKATIIDVRKEG